jgi:hypothetical protein
MEGNLYLNALMLDPYLAATIRAMLDDGLIDRAAAVLAWRVIAYNGCNAPESRHSPDIVVSDC